MADWPHHLVTKDPVNSPDDLRGLKLPAGRAIANWLQGTGAGAVKAALPEFYNSISPGVADSAVMTINGMLPFKIHEIARTSRASKI